MGYKIVTFFTKHTPYEQEIEKLKKSCEKLSIKNLIIYSTKSRGSWEANCHIKAEKILKALAQTDHDIVWIDADATFIKKPVLFDELAERNDFDMSCYYLKSNYNPNELLSGTLYLKNNIKIKDLVKIWIELNSQNNEWDQRNLQNLIDNEYKNKIIIEPLPVEYIKINGNRHQRHITNPVITHHQASRRFKKIITNSNLLTK